MSFDDEISGNDKIADCTSVFECKKCGDCCRGYGGTYVTDEDIVNICSYTGIDKKKLVAEYCVFSGGRPVLAQKADGFCVFWDELCRIHPVKPKMCRDWPFIRAVLKHPGNWRIMSGSCPGINPDADEKHIIRCVKQHQSERPGKTIRKKGLLK